MPWPTLTEMASWMWSAFIRQVWGVSLGNGDGTFGPYIILGYGTELGATATVTQAVDLNGDGKPDVIEFYAPGSSIFTLINTTSSAAGATFSPASITFPSQNVGTSSSQSTVTVTNTGAIALKVTSISISGANASEFSQTNTCTTVQPATSCTIKVTFTPTAAGAASASVVVTDNAGSGSQTIGLSGTGVASSFLLAPETGSPSSATVNPGEAATFKLNVTPSGSFSGTVNFSCSVNPSVAKGPSCKVPSSVQVNSGTAASVTVTVNTTASTAAGLIGQASYLPPISIISMFWLLGSILLLAAKRVRRPIVVAPLLALVLISLTGCGGNSSSSNVGTSGSPGTPANTYTVTVSATSGSITSQTNLTLVVQ